MKVLIVLFCGLIVVFLFSCQNQSSVTQNITSDSLETVIPNSKVDSSVEKSPNLNTVDSTVMPNTTLDSLQGAWISTIDEKDHVKIVSNQYLETYEGDTAISRNEIFFADTCVDDILSYAERSKLDGTRESGRFMVLADISDTSGNLCYQIDHIDAKHLVLYYRGKTLEFHK